MSPEPNPPLTCTITDDDQRAAQWREVLRGTTAPTDARPLLHHLFGEDTPVRSAC